MEKYEDKIYSLGEAVTGQTQAMSQAVQKTLENNGGVGIMTGSYDQNLSLLVLLPIFAYKKDTCPNSASVLTVSLYNHISISYKNYRNLFRSHIFSIYAMETMATG